MSLRIEAVIVRALQKIAPVVVVLQRRNRNLADQLDRASASILLNTAEGAYSQKGNQKARYFSALGSASGRAALFLLAVARLACARRSSLVAPAPAPAPAPARRSSLPRPLVAPAPARRSRACSCTRILEPCVIAHRIGCARLPVSRDPDPDPSPLPGGIRDRGRTGPETGL